MLLIFVFCYFFRQLVINLFICLSFVFSVLLLFYFFLYGFSVQNPPTPMFMNVAEDHSSFRVVIFNAFYLRFSFLKAVVTLSLNGKSVAFR